MSPLLDLPAALLEQWLVEKGYPIFRRRQIYRWIYHHRASHFDQMSDLPQSMRTQLAGNFRLWSAEVVAHRQSADGTEKLALSFEGGGTVESVLLRDGLRRSICISTQVGCAMGCVFCASGLNGVDRNLTTGEMIEQMLRLSALLPPDERLSHVVVMGMGEPLANLQQLLPALEQATDPAGLGISPRRITISTVGLPVAIHQLAENRTRYNLAVSLHAPNDALRNELVPVNQATGLSEILAAADRYFHTSGRRLTFEYVLLGGVNDQIQHARELTRLLRGRPAMLNVIPYNPVEGLPYRTPTTASQHRFRDVLCSGGLNVQFRQRKGDRINAACGQLRRSSASLVDAITK